MPTAAKAAAIEEIKKQLQRSKLAVMSDYRGLNVAEITNLRRRIREAGADFHVTKNTLLRIAADAAGIVGLDPLLVGPTAVAYGAGDEVAMAKLLTEYSKASRSFSIKGGLLEKKYITAAQISELATLPAREVLIGRVVGGMQAPISGLVGVLNGILSGLVYVLNARTEQLKSASY